MKLPRLVKVFKEQDILLLHGVKEYQQKVLQECKERQAATEAACLENIVQAEQSSKKLLADLSEKLYSESKQQIDALLNDLEQNLYPIIYRILHKLQIDTFQHEQISKVIQNELHEIVENKPLIIYSNAHSIDKLKDFLSDCDYSLTFKLDNELIDEQCKIDGGLFVLFVDFNESKSKIKELLSLT